MTLWLGVCVAYMLILAVGLSLGVTLARKFPGGGDWYVPHDWTPTPTGDRTLV